MIVSVHGGGWVYGDKERYQYYCMSLAQHGFAVVNFTYRLAPEHKYPAAIEDTNAVFEWVFENADEYDFKVLEGFRPTAVALNCGAYKIDVSAGTNDLTIALMGDYLPEKRTDFLLEQAPILEAKLLEKKIPHEFHFYGDKDHELGHVFHCNMKSEDAAKCNKDECDFFKKFL